MDLFPTLSEIIGADLPADRVFDGESLTGNVGRRLKVTVLQDANSSGEFLEFDKVSGTHSVGALQASLYSLDLQVDRLRNVDTSQVFKEASTLLLHDQRIRNSLDSEFDIPNENLLMPFAIHDLIENIIILCRAIFRALDGDVEQLHNVRLHPTSPIESESEQIKREMVSRLSVQQWLESP